MVFERRHMVDQHTAGGFGLCTRHARAPDVLVRLRKRRAADWKRFLAARSDELRPGGRLVVLIPGPPEPGAASVRPLMQTLASTLRRLVVDGSLRLPVTARSSPAWRVLVRNWRRRLSTAYLPDLR